MTSAFTSSGAMNLSDFSISRQGLSRSRDFMIHGGICSRDGQKKYAVCFLYAAELNLAVYVFIFLTLKALKRKGNALLPDLTGNTRR